jgi:MoaA/NifB/PqqE/SkfB family radical SAM enzyme
MINFPRLPLEGNIDLTYRCNNNCHHCWLRLPVDAPEGKEEFTFDEIRKIVDEARALGCRRWSISGGEPMLRPDFADIFDYLTRKSISYTLNTNGSLITPAIAQLLKRKGAKLIALCGATADVHDHITRTPDSFEATMRGFFYLKKAGAGFVVQLVPMRDNYHQFNDMVKLAQSLSPHYRVGAPWLYLSACGSETHNREIARQRLAPKEVIALDQPNITDEDTTAADPTKREPACSNSQADDRLFAACIANRRDFHIDPYGRMAFCAFIKDPALRYDLRPGTFQQAWEEFIPSLADVVRGGKEYQENCARCALRSECRWCPVYGYLEHRRFSAKVEYLCQVAQETRRFRNDWKLHHRRYYQIAGITIQVDSDLPITDQTFAAKFKKFQVEGPGDDTISIRHHFSLPDLKNKELGREVYRKPPWAIYHKGNSWIYLGISTEAKDHNLHKVAVFNENHTRGRIYNRGEDNFRAGNLHSLTMFPSDQILLARVLADREACYLHAAGIVLDGQGMLFVGHSDAGKSTIATMLQNEGEVLCDDRTIVRRWQEGFRIHGTWSHGDVPQVSATAAPLQAILFLEKNGTNSLIPIDRKETAKKLLPFTVKSLVTPDWWEKILILIEKLAQEVPAYRLRFDKSGKVKEVLKSSLINNSNR